MSQQRSSGVQLVGREREQGVLRQQLDAMLAGQGCVLLVSGEAGIGKTTLVEWLAGEAEAQGALVLWGHAYDLSVTPPYGPWLEIARGYQTRPLSPDLLAVPAFIDDPQALAQVGSQAKLFAAVGAFFAALSAHRPLVLVLDDFHWADQASIQLARHLARQIAGFRILLVIIYRSDELHRDHPLYAAAPLLAREGVATRVELRRLSAASQRALIRQRYSLDGPDQQRLETYLEARTEGNPLFVTELLRTLEEERILLLAGHGWHLGDLRQVGVPLLLRQVIDGRLTRLSDTTRRLLQVAAVIGQTVPLDLWQQVSGASDEVLIEAVEQGQTAHLIEEAADGTAYRFRHALLREALYKDLTALRRRNWHRTIAESLAALPTADPDTVADHFYRAADARAVAWLTRALDRARRSYAFSTAVSRLEVLIALIERDGGSDLVRENAPTVPLGWLYFVLARLRRYTEPGRMLPDLEKARALGEATGDQGLIAFTTAARGIALVFSGHYAAGLRDLARAADGIERLSDPELARIAAMGEVSEAWLRCLRGTWMVCAAAAGYCDEVLGLAAWWSQIEEPQHEFGQDGSSYGGGWDGLGTAYAITGRIAEARAALDHALRIYLLIGHHVMVAAAALRYLQLVVLPFQSDRIAERERLTALAVEALRHVPEDRPGAPEAAGHWLDALEGRWSAMALADFEALMVAPIEAGYAVLVDIYRARGEREQALSVIERALPAGPFTEPGSRVFQDSVNLQARAAALALDAGDAETARQWLEVHDRWLDWASAVLGRAERALLWGRYHHVRGDLADARQLAERAFRYASEPRQPLALIAVHRFLGQLDTEAEQLDTAEPHLQESLKLAEACAAPFERALTLLELAQLRATQGKTDDTRVLLAEVRAICEPLGATPTLERVGALEARLAPTPKPSYPAGLSPREVEVLRLVAQGLSDAEVAERLYLSPRTVSQHLRNSYHKLGVSSRTAATRFVVEQGLA